VQLASLESCDGVFRFQLLARATHCNDFVGLLLVKAKTLKTEIIILQFVFASDLLIVFTSIFYCLDH